MMVGKTQTVAIELFAVSAAYIVLFTFTFSVIMPAQSIIFTLLPMNISLLFLPHGVRILAIYLYGWRAALYLFPAHLATWAYLYFYLGSEQSISASIVSILASLLAMLIVFQKVEGVTSVTKKGNWKGILLAGAIASLLNTRTCNPLRHGRWPKHGMDNDNLGFHDRGCFRFIFPDDRYDLCIPLN